jgi:hypothetical protein
MNMGYASQYRRLTKWERVLLKWDRYIRGIESGDRKASGLLLRCLELLEFYNTYHKIRQDIQERYDANKN